MNQILPVALAIFFTMTGCASYGGLSYPGRYDSGVSLTDILSQTDQYTVHYHGNSEKIVSGILFDPKGDGKRIRPEGMYWTAVTEPETIASITRTIKRSDHPGYYPRLYGITDHGGELYGYLYTGWSYLAVRQLDEHTLKVFGLKGPPEYADMYPNGP